MEARDTTVLELRGETFGMINNQSSSEETFQNKTLRPILKMQNDLFIQKGYVNIFYDVNKDIPNSGSTNNVFYLVKFLKNYPDSKITLEGFADETGNSAANIDLSNRRAQKLLEIIKGSGIDTSRIKLVARGVNTEFLNNELGYNLSRRVSIILE